MSERPQRQIRHTLVKPKLSFGLVPTIPFYLLVAVVAWFCLVPGVYVSIPGGAVVLVGMAVMTAHDPHWFEILYQRMQTYLRRLIRTRGRSRHYRNYKAGR